MQKSKFFKQLTLYFPIFKIKVQLSIPCISSSIYKFYSDKYLYTLYWATGNTFLVSPSSCRLPMPNPEPLNIYLGIKMFALGGGKIKEVSFLLQRVFPRSGDSFPLHIIMMNTVLLAFIIV